MKLTRSVAGAALGAATASTIAVGALTSGTSAASAQPEGSVVAAAARPALQVPFRCGQGWRADTREKHSPSKYSIDFNKGSGSDDLGLPVLASASGTVTKVRKLTTSYGHYVEISHGNGWSTLYAHLQQGSINVVEGERVSPLTQVGKVGGSGGVTPHLHYEQKLNGTVQPAIMNGHPAKYPATPGPTFTRPC